MVKRTLMLADEGATAALGEALADSLLGLADEIRTQGFTLGLTGDLGAGKTALVRALLRRAGATGSVKSPTFSLLEPYELSRLNFYHFDFYRFKDPAEFLERGFDEYFSAGGVCLVEWPERAAGYLPEPDLQIELHVDTHAAARSPGADWAEEPASTRRRAEVTARTRLGELCLQRMPTAQPQASAGA